VQKETGKEGYKSIVFGFFFIFLKLFSFFPILSLSQALISPFLSRRRRRAAGGGATVFSGEPHRKIFKIKTFFNKPLLFYMLIPNPNFKFKKKLTNRPDRRQNGVGKNLSFLSRTHVSIFFFSFPFFSVFVCV
jgi:hypothetical protein